MTDEMLNTPILILDDHPIQVKIMMKTLENHGFTRVTGLSDPLECLSCYLRERPQLVIVDLDMPGMDGHHVMTRLLEEAGGEFLPFLVVTASQAKEDLLRAYRCGARDFISRPVHREELILRVLNLLAVQQAFRRLPAALRQPGGRVARETLLQGTILVVEDDPLQNRMFDKMLQKGGFTRVLGVRSPGQLPQVLAALHGGADVVVLDLRLGEGETDAMITTLLDTDPAHRPAILAITALEDNERRWNAFRLGVRDFLPKPFDWEVLVAKVANLMELRMLV